MTTSGFSAFFIYIIIQVLHPLPSDCGVHSASHNRYSTISALPDALCARKITAGIGWGGKLIIDALTANEAPRIEWIWFSDLIFRITLNFSIVRFYTQQRRRHIVQLWNVVRNREKMLGKKTFKRLQMIGYSAVLPTLIYLESISFDDNTRSRQNRLFHRSNLRSSCISLSSSYHTPRL